MKKKCNICNGSGINKEREPCSICGGSGELLVIEANPERQEMMEFLEENKNKRSDFTPEKPNYQKFKINNDINKNEVKEILKELFVEEDFFKAIIETNMTMLMESGEVFDGLKKYLKKYVDETVRIQISDANIHLLVASMINDKLKSNVGELTKAIVSEYVRRTTDKLKTEMNCMKDISYSIDAEIKHTCMKMPISYDYERRVEKHLRSTIEVLSNKHLDILQKNVKKQLERAND